MNKNRFFAAGLMAALSLTACKRTDLQQESRVANGTKSVAATDTATSSWRTYNSWSADAQEGFTTYTTSISDKRITADVVDNGLVLVFKKSKSASVSLPMEEKGDAQSYFWSYQISEGNLSVNADAYGGAKSPDAGESFSYFVLSSDRLAAVAERGYTKSQLMKLTYETAADLLK